MVESNINNRPLVSIIIATYRRDKELLRALNSVANLSYKNFEIILVDDNDEEIWNNKVKQIVKDFSLVNNKICIKYFANHPNQGSAKTRNVGIDMATGEFICFLDDDDEYLPNRIDNQLYSMIESNADFSITDLAIYNEKGKLIEFRKRDYIKETTSEKLFQNHLMYHITGTDTLMFRKDYIIKIGKFDLIDVGDEYYLMEKAILAGGRFHYLPESHVKAYIHTGDTGLSSGKSKVQGENMLYAHKQQFFHKLDSKTVKYIRVRHYIVLAYAFYRNRQFFKMVKNCILGSLISPRVFVGILRERK